MAVVQTVVKAATGLFGATNVVQDSTIVDVAYTATADKVATIAHGLVAAPQEVYITPLLRLAGPLAGTIYAATTINTTNVVVTKQSAANTADNAAQIRVTIKRPHSAGR
jgi:hypothetical protein